MKIHNLIILDASGSMESIRQQAVDGVNETIQSIRKTRKSDLEEEKQGGIAAPLQIFSLVSFNSGRDYLKKIHSDAPIEDVKEITANDYDPDSCTALYDAIGDSLTELGKKLTDDDKALVTIITDGMENSSTRFTAESVQRLIEQMKERGCVFTYIGANQDVMMEATKMGIESYMCFESTDIGTPMMWETENAARERFYQRVKRGESNLNRSFFEEEPNKFTPEHINALAPNEVFVFGSDISGNHSGGAAHAACVRFGAIVGVAEGMQGNSYAIPTTGIAAHHFYAAVDRFLNYAELHPERRFLVTRIGCGHAGYDASQVAPLFHRALTMPNVTLPRDFHDFLVK